MGYDIRRTIDVCREVTGEEISEALKEYADQGEFLNYAERIVRDIDGKKTIIMGIESRFSYECMVVYEGEDLDNNEISLSEPYEKIGIGSSEEFLPVMGFSVGFTEESVRSSVVKTKEGIEKILKK